MENDIKKLEFDNDSKCAFYVQMWPNLVTLLVVCSCSKRDLCRVAAVEELLSERLDRDKCIFACIIF